MISVSFCFHFLYLIVLKVLSMLSKQFRLTSNPKQLFNRPIRFAIRFYVFSRTWLLVRITKNRLSCSRNTPLNLKSNNNSKHQLQKFNRATYRNNKPQNYRRLSVNLCRWRSRSRFKFHWNKLASPFPWKPRLFSLRRNFPLFLHASRRYRHQLLPQRANRRKWKRRN